MKRIVRTIFVVALFAALAAPAARAEITVERGSDENPAVEISRATIAGAMTGAVVGFAFSLVEDRGKDTDPVQWGLFLGTLGGLALGVHNAYTRPQPTAMLQLDGGAVHVAALPPVEFGRGVRLRVLGASF